MKRVEKGLEDTLLDGLKARHFRVTAHTECAWYLFIGRHYDGWQHRRHATHGKWLFDQVIAATAQEQTEPHAPLDVQDRPNIGQRAVGQPRAQPSHWPQVAAIRVAGQSSLKKMHSQIILAFTFGVP